MKNSESPLVVAQYIIMVDSCWDSTVITGYVLKTLGLMISSKDCIASLD
jgi:hypothetical protein